MTIAHMLGRGGAGPAIVRHRRARVAAVIAVLCLAAGCSDPEFGEPDPQTMRDVEKCGIEKPAPGLVAPPGSYVAQGLTIDYARVRHDGGYSGKILADPRMLEQVYVDAASGNVPARWTVCLYEATSRGAARQSAKNLAGLRCQTIARCSFQPGQLKYSDATASGIRMLTLIADDFEAEARRQQVTQEILGHALTLFVSTRVLSARVRAGPAATGSRPASKRPASKQGASPPAMRELTGEELSRVRGGSPTRRRPVAAGLAKPAPSWPARPTTDSGARRAQNRSDGARRPSYQRTDHRSRAHLQQDRRQSSEYSSSGARRLPTGSRPRSRQSRWR